MSRQEYSHVIQIRSRYAETDQMGYVYYGRFAEYYEMGRVETMRSLGLIYQEMESRDGILLPVVSMQVRYLRPAFYDQVLNIKTILRSVPEDFITFFTEIRNPANQLVNAATVRLCFLDSQTKKRIPCPSSLRQVIAHAIESSPAE
jgi:acyl-CoA thioester hydrolase